MQSYLIVGPGINLDIEQIRNSFLEYNNELTIYGDSKNKIDCSSINFLENAHVVIKVPSHLLNSNKISVIFD